MKALIAILALFVAAAAGAVGGVIVTGSPATPNGEIAAHNGAGNAAAAASVSDSAKLVSRIESLNQEVADLHQEVLRLKEATHREPAAEAAPVKVVEADTTGFAASHRDAILKIIAQDREDLERKKEEERKAKDLENILARADRAAKKLGLNTTQQKALADVYVLESAKMEEMRNLRGQGDPEAARTAFTEFREWRTSELTKRLGADLAQQVNESDLAGFRGGGFGGGGRNGGQGGRGGPGGGQGGPGGNQGGGGPPGGE